MDRQVLLAIALSALVVIAYQQFLRIYYPDYAQSPRPGVSEVEGQPRGWRACRHGRRRRDEGWLLHDAGAPIDDLPDLAGLAAGEIRLDDSDQIRFRERRPLEDVEAIHLQSTGPASLH